MCESDSPARGRSAPPDLVGGSYDPVRDFVPVVLASSSPLLLVASASLPATSVAELIARTARWVHPETFRALPVWAPYAARGMPVFDASWSRQYTNTKKATDNPLICPCPLS